MGQTIGAILVLGLAVFVLVGLFHGGGSDGASNEAAPKIDPQTGRPRLDFRKPLWVMRGFPACPSTEEIDAVRQGAPNACRDLPSDWNVVVMESRGILLRSHRVRFVGLGKVVEVWVPSEALRNGD